jgi:hypothetical protein
MHLVIESYGNPTNNHDLEYEHYMVAFYVRSEIGNRKCSVHKVYVLVLYPFP